MEYSLNGVQVGMLLKKASKWIIYFHHFNILYIERVWKERDKGCDMQKNERAREDCWRNVIKSVYGVLSLPH